MISSAAIPRNGLYRYKLIREWDTGPEMVFIMLNPSTADHQDDDPTIRRCIHFAKREGCGSLRVENLFGYRATDKNLMFAAGRKSVGNTDRYISDAVINHTGPIVAAWGSDKRAVARAEFVKRYLMAWKIKVWCFGKTKSGAPKHPLYLSNDTKLERFI